MTLSEEMQAVRKNTFLSQNVFSDIIGISVAFIIRLESGKGEQKLTTFKKIKTFFEIDKVYHGDAENAWWNFLVEERENGNS